MRTAQNLLLAVIVTGILAITINKCVSSIQKASEPALQVNPQHKAECQILGDNLYFFTQQEYEFRVIDGHSICVLLPATTKYNFVDDEISGGVKLLQVIDAVIK